LQIIPFDSEAASHYAWIRARLKASGQMIGPGDLVIAATTIAVGATLVTHNTGEFSRIPGLVIEDWL
jgi:tRNA(fMet)-specific endonuclease VapC